MINFYLTPWNWKNVCLTISSYRILYWQLSNTCANFPTKFTHLPFYQYQLNWDICAWVFLHEPSPSSLQTPHSSAYFWSVWNLFHKQYNSWLIGPSRNLLLLEGHWKVTGIMLGLFHEKHDYCSRYLPWPSPLNMAQMHFDYNQNWNTRSFSKKPTSNALSILRWRIYKSTA